MNLSRYIPRNLHTTIDRGTMTDRPMRKFCGFIFLCAPAAIALAVAGCSHPRGEPAIGDADTDLNVLGIKKAVRTKDLRHAAKFVSDLESDDPAVRFYAIHGLKTLTGETFGYLYYADDDARKPAVKQWQTWLKSRGGTTRPSEGAMTRAGGDAGGDGGR